MSLVQHGTSKNREITDIRLNLGFVCLFVFVGSEYFIMFM